MGLDNLLKGKQVAAVICNQWGDTGKGKFSDYLASQWADVSARGTGGNNAGHTVVVKGKEKIFHLLPAGITNDCDGHITILGNGMVIDLGVLCRELQSLESEGGSYNHLMVSKDASVIMPFHVQRDMAKDGFQQGSGIGSTGRGIGPCYTDKIARRGIFISDLLDRDRLSRKIDKVKEFYPEQELDKCLIIDQLMPFAERIRPLIRDTVHEIHVLYRQGKKISLEGAQGLLLSVEHGTYPYVTSSDCSLNGTASGVGLPASAVDLPLGIVKFPFMTRVGAGPFPTEFGGLHSERYCGDKSHDKRYELNEHEIPFTESDGKVRYDAAHPKILRMMNSDDEFVKGIGIRLAAGEYGATTGRARRTGWTDAVAAKYAVGINGPLMVLTKADAIAGAGKFSICYGYDQGDTDSEIFCKDEQVLRNSKPIYADYQGYGNIGHVKSYSRLPKSLRASIDDFERFTHGKVAVVSVGPDREQTIIR